jgi:hypothetical protein
MSQKFHYPCDFVYNLGPTIQPVVVLMNMNEESTMSFLHSVTMKPNSVCGGNRE